MRPPKEFEGKPWHWVRCDEGHDPGPMLWTGRYWNGIGDRNVTSPEEASRLGWVWLGVAEPPGGEG